jgi:periplasmic protein TonB
MDSSRFLRPLAFSASLAMHAVALSVPSTWLVWRELPRDESRPFLTARLEPRVESDPSAEELLKNTIKPSPEPTTKAEEKPPPRTDSKTPSQRKRHTTAKIERLSEAELGETLARLSETLLYPPDALRLGLEGEVVLLLEIDQSGRLVSASVAASSGHGILDAAAIRAARHVRSFGDSAAGKAILLPVRFKLS